MIWVYLFPSAAETQDIWKRSGSRPIYSSSFFHQGDPSAGVVVAFDVMAVPRMAAGNQDTIGSLFEGVEDV